VKNKIWMSLAVLVVLLSLSWIASSQEPKNNMTFFITSVGSGKGADLGGLAVRTSIVKPSRKRRRRQSYRHAYLSTSAADGKPPSTPVIASAKVVANAKGVVIAKTSTIYTATTIRSTKKPGLSEKGETSTQAAINQTCTTSSRVQPDGRAFSGSEDMTCRNWTSRPPAPRCSAITTARDCATTNHPDRGIRRIHPRHRKQGGCSQEGLRSSGGNGCSTASPPIS